MKKPRSRRPSVPHGRSGPRVRSSKPAGRHRRPAREELRVVHDDRDLVVVEKPAGLLTSDAPGSDRESAASLIFERQRGHVVHRLDGQASGLLVFAKNERTLGWLKEDLRSHRVNRKYVALVAGSPSEPSGIVHGFLKEGTDGSVRPVSPRRTGEDSPSVREDRARLAATSWRVLARGQGVSLLEVTTHSGRKHQVRVHLAEAGHPIVGDRRYGGPAGARLFLHASELGFRHPGTGEALTFTSQPAAAFYELVGVARAPKPAPPTPPVRPRRPPASLLDTSWDSVAPWYDSLIREGRSSPLRDVVLPGVLRLLGPSPEERVLDVACGEGALCRALSEMGCDVQGVDLSPRLITRASGGGKSRVRYHVGDARDLGALGLGRFDAVTCVMALMNMDPLDSVWSGLAQCLEPGGRLIWVVLHPAFRAPRQTSWAHEGRGRDQQTFRRVDGYLSSGEFQIVMNPGSVSGGGRPITTWTFHRSLGEYFRGMGAAGFLVEALEEWPARLGPTSDLPESEARAHREIPMFLAVRAVRRGAGGFGAGGP